MADVKVVATRFGLESGFSIRSGTTIAGNPVAKLRCSPFKCAAGGFCIVPIVLPFTVYQKAHGPLPSLL